MSRSGSTVASARTAFQPVSDGTSLRERIGVAATVGNAEGGGFGVAVVVDLSVTDSQSASLEDLRQAIGALRQEQQQSRQFQKSAAARKLDEAIRELGLLKLFGSGLAAAKQAVQISKQIASAVQDYAAAVNGGGSATADSADTAAAALSAQDPVIAEANEALAWLRNYLGKLLPGLRASSDGKTRAVADDLKRQFDAAEAAAQAAVPDLPATDGAARGLVDLVA
jgi:hypothetical protein